MPSPIRVIRAHARRPEPHISVSRDRCFCLTRVFFRRKDSRIYIRGTQLAAKTRPALVTGRRRVHVDVCTSTRARARKLESTERASFVAFRLGSAWQRRYPSLLAILVRGTAETNRRVT